jgi:O-antigen ligase
LSGKFNFSRNWFPVNRIVRSYQPPQPVEGAGIAARTRLTVLERGLLLVGIVEIPLGIDKFFHYQQEFGTVGSVAGYNVSLTSICLLGLYATWILTVAKKQVVPQRILFGLPLLIYIGAVWLSVFSAENGHLAMNEAFLLWQAYGLFFYLANRVRDPKDFLFIGICFGLSLLIQGLVMIGLKAAGASMYDRRVDIGPIPFSVAIDGRTEGTLLSPVVAGSLMALMFLVQLPWFLTAKKKSARWFLGACLGAGLIGLLFTQTRGAILTVFVGSAIVGCGMLARGWLPRWTIWAAVAGIFMALIPLATVIEKRVVEGDEGSAESRVHLSAIAFQTIQQQPIFGHGAGNCYLACQNSANSPPYRSEWYYTIHCKYLVVWIETGLIGLVAFAAVLMNGFRYGLVTWMRRHPYFSPMGLGCAAALLGHGLHMFVDIFNSRAQVQMLWVVLGVVAALYQASKPVPQIRRLGT